MKFKKSLVALVLGAVLLLSQSAYAGAEYYNTEEYCFLSTPLNENKTVYLGGQTVGVALYTKGLLISDITAIETESKFITPANGTGLKKGDYILSANGIEMDDVSNMDAVLLNSKGEKIKLHAVRGEKEFDTEIIPVKCVKDDRYRLGLWLRDSAAGLGTVTYVDPDNNSFMALGHSICDSMSGELMSVRDGRIVECTVTGIQKGEKNKAGELKGVFGVNALQLGEIKDNRKFGLSGTVNGEFDHGESVAVGNKNEVHEGEAFIYSDFETGDVKKYDVEIVHVNSQTYPSEKSFVFKVVDEGLIEKTGGILQGMSGSPIVQDGKLIGAVTHVMLSDPSRGYGVFLEWMAA